MNIGMILAGGFSQRMNLNGSLPKQFVEVCGRPVIAYTLDIFQEDSSIDGIAVVLRQEHFPLIEEIKNKYGFTKIRWIIESGEQRHDTVYNALNFLEDQCSPEDIIVSLSAVTPIINKEVIAKSIEAAEEFGTATAAIPLRATLLISGAAQEVLDVPDRRNYRAITEPHTYRYDIIKKAYDKAYAEGYIDESMTDDVQILHRFGACQKIIEGNTDFIKITYRNDLKVFEQYLKDREGMVHDGV